MQIIQSNLLKKFTKLDSVFTTRYTGVSQAPYDSLNLAFHVEDNPNDVETNHDLLAKELGYEKESLIHMRQIHSNLVHIVNSNDYFLAPRECDALITDRPDIPLMVMVADCSPVLFYDEGQKVIAVAHAGRQGAFKNIVKNVLGAMEHAFKSNPENIYVTIGASIGVCCYEVGSEIYDEAKEIGLEYAFEVIEDKYYLDVNKILKSQLLAYGIKEENLEISDECTCCHNEKYFSYRADGVTGRFAGVIKLIQ